MWQNYLQPTTIEEVLGLLHEHAGQARIVAGGTDVLVELQRGIKPTSTLIDITNLRDLKYIRLESDTIHLGALATHNDVLASRICFERALPLAQACIEVGAPQIRTRATVAGNVITGSPANDTITPLMALSAEVVLTSLEGERIVPLDRFYMGVRRTTMQPNELLREIRFPAMRPNQRGLFIKLGLRRAQAISVIHIAIVLTFDGDKVSKANITLGALAPTIVHSPSAEAFLVGKELTPQVCKEAGRLACTDVKPIDDLRGSAEYRLATLAALVSDGLQRIAVGTQAEGFPEKPVLLDTSTARAGMQEATQPPVGLSSTINDPAGGQGAAGPSTRSGDTHMKPSATTEAGVQGAASPQTGIGVSPISPLESPPSPAGEGGRGVEVSANLGSQDDTANNAVSLAQFQGVIETTINGQHYRLEHAQNKSLLNALREDAGLTGTKEGCAEGECGACTVWINGQAAMSCLVPAPQAHSATITTIEGLETEQGLHPLQQSFINHAAVQCGYCIPGFIMAGAKLLDEKPDPDLNDIQVALSGNICRCTGYRKILDAMVNAKKG
jgi:xanthine dehydrogenase iron-sulfur cluster and FAD-binding subunit A